jgi:hypothetical protein
VGACALYSSSPADLWVNAETTGDDATDASPNPGHAAIRASEIAWLEAPPSIAGENSVHPLTRQVCFNPFGVLHMTPH